MATTIKRKGACLRKFARALDFPLKTGTGPVLTAREKDSLALKPLTRANANGLKLQLVSVSSQGSKMVFVLHATQNDGTINLHGSLFRSRNQIQCEEIGVDKSQLQVDLRLAKVPLEKVGDCESGKARGEFFVQVGHGAEILQMLEVSSLHEDDVRVGCEKKLSGQRFRGIFVRKNHWEIKHVHESKCGEGHRLSFTPCYCWGNQL